MHSPVNLIVVNEIARDRIAEAESARRARQSKPAAPWRSAGSRRRRWTLLLRGARTA